MLDFSKGFKKYELETAMQFDSIYSMRFYELLSGQKSPLTFEVEHLKEMFQVQGKYAQINDFFKRVIDPAKKELDAKSPYSFDVKMNRTGKKITSFTFLPVYRAENRDSDLARRDLQKQVQPSWDLEKNVLECLKTAFLFSSAEIKQNMDLFKRAQFEMDDFMAFMSQVKPRANRADNPKGYLINAIRKELGA
jgi:plasmid replication initiation protein